jgi:hypothetical protein
MPKTEYSAYRQREESERKRDKRKKETYLVGLGELFLQLLLGHRGTVRVQNIDDLCKITTTLGHNNCRKSVPYMNLSFRPADTNARVHAPVVKCSSFTFQAKMYPSTQICHRSFAIPPT